MGNHKQTHIGVYIKAKYPIKNKSEFYNSCLNSKCDNYSLRVLDRNFCSHCGKVIEKYENKFPQKITWYDIADQSAFDCDAVYDIYTDEDYMILLPNQKKYIPQNWEKKQTF